MKHFTRPSAAILIISSSIFNTVYAQSTADKTIITTAAQLTSAGQCDGAIIKLEGVSDEGKQSNQFLLAAARAHDCKNHISEALGYYRKYLALGADDSVRKRFDVLNQQQAEQEKSTREQEKIKENYRQTAGIEKTKKNKKGKFRAYSFGVEMPIAKSPSPFTFGLRYTSEYYKPIMDKKAYCNLSFSYMVYGPARKSWYSKMSGIPTDNIESVDWAVGGDILASFPYTIGENSDLKWYAGPIVGYRVQNIHNADARYGESIQMPVAHGPVFGLGTSLILESGWIFSLNYNWFHYKSAKLGDNLPDLNMNLSTIALKVSIRFSRR